MSMTNSSAAASLTVVDGFIQGSARTSAGAASRYTLTFYSIATNRLGSTVQPAAAPSYRTSPIYVGGLASAGFSTNQGEAGYINPIALRGFPTAITSDTVLGLGEYAHLTGGIGWGWKPTNSALAGS